MLCTAGGAERSYVAQDFTIFFIRLVEVQSVRVNLKNVPQFNSMGNILTIYSKTTITIITKLLRWYHRVVHNIPAKF